jgi:hypothetical protein
MAAARQHSRTFSAPGKGLNLWALIMSPTLSKLQLQEFAESLQAGRVPAIPLKPISIPKAIRALQDQYPNNWGAYDDLEKRYYEAKKVWNYARRLKMFGDRWHPDHPENS